MRKGYPKSLLLTLMALPLALMSQNTASKTWLGQMQDKRASLYDIQKTFYADPENPFARKEADAGEDEEEKGGGWELFKRYEAFAAPRVYPSGDRSQLSRTHAEYQAYLQSRSAQRGPGSPVITANTWSYFNPNNIPSKGGAGRVNCITADPANASNLWLGTPDGGLWKSTNGGTSWSTSTDLFTDLGVSDIAISPTSSQTMFVATGDRDGYYSGSNHCFSYGIMRSTDGGTTWTNVYSLAVNSQAMISRILIDPSNTQNIYAAGSMGIIKSTNGGTTWTTSKSTTDVIWSMEFKPGTSSTIYACGTGFYMSTNSGTAWTTVTSGLPAASAVFRMSIGVSAANAAIVYVLAADQAGTVMNGLYQSTNSGTSFTQQHAGTNPNLLGFQQNGSDGTAGQSFYTLSIGVNPTNASEVMVGGVNVWKSSDGGSTWGSSAITYWAASHTATNYVHADIHHIYYQNGTTVLIGCDGGIFKTTNTGTSWSDICTNLQISQPYSLGMSTTNAAKVLSGWQDNGTNLMTTTTAWTSTLGGDGMKCFVDRTNDNVLYGEQYNGNFNRSTNGGTGWTTLGPPNSSETTAWATPWKQDPVTANTIYGGMTNLYKSTNQGTSWTVMGTMPDAADYINEFAIAPSNPQVIYVVKNGGVFKTVNGGSAWTTITGTIPSTLAATYVAVCPTNPNIAYVTVSGYTAGSKVYVTADGGTTWTNYSTGLPNLPANCITYSPNAHGAVYIGMDVGVYYRDSTLSTWQAYNTGLPNAIVMQMEIYAATGKLRAATFGRGIWEVPLYVPSAGTAPTATFSASSTSICAGASVNFTDNSTGTPTAWSWSFPGGTPATSAVQNPSGIVFATAGSYTVSLTASNASGNNSHTQVITVSGKPVVTSSASSSTFCAGGSSTLTAGGASTYSWSPSTGLSSTTSASVTASPTSSVTYTVTGTSAGGCTNTSTVALTVNPKPAITGTASASSFCAGGTSSLTAGGGTTYSWSPSTGLSATTGSPVTASPAATTTYTVTGTNAGGCSNTATVAITVNPKPVLTGSPASPTICAGGNIVLTESGASTYTWSPSTGLSSTTSASVTASPATTMTYTVGGASAAGCTSTTTVTVTVNTSITASAGSNASVCPGKSTQLNASGGSTYSWNPPTGLSSTTIPNPVASPSATTTYTVTVHSGTCSGTSTVTVSLSAVPPTPVVTGAGSVLSTSATGVTYQWYLNGTLIPGATSQTYTGTTFPGNYMVTVTNTAGCSASSASYLATGIEDHQVIEEFNLFPNPNNGVFDLNVNVNEPGNYMLNVYDMIGKLVFTESLPNLNGHFHQTITLQGCSAGVYMLSLSNAKQHAVRKVIVY